jgi:hypothetical protein
MTPYSTNEARQAIHTLCVGEQVHIPTVVTKDEQIELMGLFTELMQREDVQRGDWEFDFCTLEEARSDQALAQRPLDQLDDPDIGFVWRRGEKNDADGTEYDVKLFFHYRPVLEVLLKQRGVVLDATAKHFLELTRTTYHRAYDAGRAIAAQHPNDPELAQLYDDSEEHVLRILAYLEERDDNSGLIAAPHKDRGLFTFVLGTSHTGLEFANSFDGEYTPATCKDGKMIVFPGAKWETRYPNISAHPHQVRNHNLESFSQEIIRWSMVFFAHGDFERTVSTKPPKQ